MSLILEALKKSEAERQLGRAPGLMTPMTSVRRRRRSIWPWLAVGVLTAAVGAISWWWAVRPSPSDAPSDAPSIAAAADVPTEPVASPAVAILAPEPAQPPKLPMAAPREVAPRSNASAAVSASPREVKVEPMTASAAPPAPPLVTAPAQEPIIAESVAVKPVAAPPPPAPPVEALPRLEQLSASERDGLPALKLSMHVWSEIPEGRFVLIDGRRYREGEKLSAALRIVEIRRDGTVLDLNGRRFLLARP